MKEDKNTKVSLLQTRINACEAARVLRNQGAAGIKKMGNNTLKNQIAQLDLLDVELPSSICVALCGRKVENLMVEIGENDDPDSVKQQIHAFMDAFLPFLCFHSIGSVPPWNSREPSFLCLWVRELARLESADKSEKHAAAQAGWVVKGCCWLQHTIYILYI